MARPIIVVNFKTYPTATGEEAVKLAKACERVARERGADIRICVQALDLSRVIEAVTIPVYAQHADNARPDKNTGRVTPYALLQHGALGTLLNHSERQIPLPQVKETIALLKECKLDAIVCANTPGKAREMEQQGIKPLFFAVEPPELIGGTVSVSEAQPDVIRNAVQMVRTPVLVGAGVHSAKDVMIAVELGAVGVLLASAIDLAKDPYQALLDLIPE